MNDLGVFAMEREPTRAELAAIEAEWPSIAADLAEVDREIAAIRAAEDASLIRVGGAGRGKTSPAAVTLAAFRLPVAKSLRWAHVAPSMVDEESAGVAS
ncbi:hypothetical protein Ga0074812_11543 [Parafrankia irregularis]|uniref:Uncharacterized protein n=1 Tax=Parafrankia irregularis TaxID=795642 RepID=A0A0S4QQK0_9ACTN|nr:MULTISPECIES: DUF6284 family protein [Parafrankia]MBE3202657.1 hypothetical protein [Parafrankia sp. CH37]CUU57841.1 hypothetical protein Ga0074812_11543 [Parafrankia irregularis]